MDRSTKLNELDWIIEKFSDNGVMTSEVRPAILTLAQHLKALESKDEEQRGKVTKPQS